jgi:hypothetical protein
MRLRRCDVAPQNGYCWACFIYKSLLFPNANLIEDAKQHFEIYAILLPLRMVATAIKVLCTYYSRIFGYDLNPHFQPFSLTLYKWTVIYLFYCYSIFRFSASAHFVSDKEGNHMLGEKWTLLIFLTNSLCSYTSSYIVCQCCTSSLDIHYSVHKSWPSFIP